MTRVLPALLALMGIAVILILAGAGTAGLTFGLLVVGVAGILLVRMVLRDVTNSEARDWASEDRQYRRPPAGGF